MSSPSLADNVLQAAIAFFKYANDANVRAVLIGGGALGMHGLLRRTTKDLDLNVGRDVLSQRFKSTLPIVPSKHPEGLDVPGTWLWREHEEKHYTTVKATWLSGRKKDVSLDIKVYRNVTDADQKELDTLFRYSLVSYGICYVQLGPLLATKIKAVLERSESKTSKHFKDDEDIQMSLLAMVQNKQKMPEEVMARLLKPTDLQTFLMLPKFGIWSGYLGEIGIGLDSQSQQSSSAHIEEIEGDD